MEVTVKSIPVNYEEYGTGIPVLMLHGNPSDHRHMVSTFEPIFENRPGWRRLYPDLPGLGKTPGADWITTQDDMLAVASEFIQTVAPGQRFVVIGTSYGSYMARGFVYQHGANMDGVLLLTPAIEQEEAKRQLPPQQVIVEDAQFDAAVTPQESYLPGMFVVHSVENLTAFRTHMLPALRIADHAFLARLGDESKFTFPVDELATPFPAPALILTGRQDSLVGYEDAWGILDNYPRGTFAVLDRAGHFLEFEQTSLLHAHVHEWLNRVEEYRQAH